MFSLQEFDCVHLENIVGYKNSEELEKFFKEILENITRDLRIKREKIS